MANSTYKQWIELLYLLVLKELKVRYKRSFFGYLWAIANPFIFALVYCIAFKFIMRVQMENYILFLLTGMFPWAWLSQSVIQGAGSFTNNQSLVRRVVLPKFILPLSNVMQEMIHFIFAIPVIWIFFIINGKSVYYGSIILQLPIMIIIQVFITFPLTLMGAIMNVYVRDVHYLIGIFFSVLFFTTPMVYPLSMVPIDYQFYFTLNPFYWLIDSWRLVFNGEIIPIYHLLNLAFYTLIFSILSLYCYRRLTRRIAELV